MHRFSFPFFMKASCVQAPRPSHHSPGHLYSNPAEQIVGRAEPELQPMAVGSKTGAVLSTSGRLRPEVADGESYVVRNRSLRDMRLPVTARVSFPRVPLKIKEL